MSFKTGTNHQLSPLITNAAEHTVDQLREGLVDLQHALEVRTQENVLLNEVISTVASTLRLDEVLRHLVDTFVRATSCQIAFIYLYDKEKERLVLASTSNQYQHLVGKIEMALGEGIAGWVALHRETVSMKDGALEDPRFCYFPELEEEKFQSIMTVPIIAKDRHLIGAITLQAVAPHEFTEQHQQFINNTAVLVAGAIENAQLYENTQRKLSILTSLSILSQTISSGLYLDDMLRSLATLTVQIMEVDLCVIMLMDQARERDAEPSRQARRLTIRATSPNLNERTSFHSIDIDRQVLEQLRAVNEASLHEGKLNGQYGEISDFALERLNPIKDAQYKSLLSAPLIAGTEQLGLINCYSSKARRYSSEDQTLLTTIANQAAIAIKNSHLVNQLAQKNLVKGFFDDLMHGTSDSEDSLRQRASFLGCDLTRVHAVVMIEISQVDERKHAAKPTENVAKKEKPTAVARLAEAVVVPEENSYSQGVVLQTAYKRVSGMIRRRIQDTYPGSVLYEHENMLTCVISLTKDPTGIRLKSWLQDLSYQTRKEHGVRLSIGIGNACQNINDYRRGFPEANEALQMGQNLHRETTSEEKLQPVITHFNDLGVYRYLYKIARMDDLRDVYQDQIARIDSYDRRKNTDLLDTLEIYMECAGNLTKTSERLFVHRNTLIQRLERLQSICDIDLQDRSNWLTLQVAIKVYKLRAGSI